MLHLVSFLMKINVTKECFRIFNCFLSKKGEFFDREKGKKSYKVLKGDRKRKARISPFKGF